MEPDPRFFTRRRLKKKGPTRIPNVYCYARVSTKWQSTANQAYDLNIDGQRIAAECGGVYKGCEEEPESAWYKRYYERPKLGALIKAVEPGDHLVVEYLDRLDRDMFKLPEVLQLLYDRAVVVHATQERTLGGGQVRLDTEEGRMHVWFAAFMAERLRRYTSDRTRHAVQTRIAQGYHAGTHAPIGRRCVRFPTGRTMRNGRATYRYLLVWDKREVEYCLEIHRRRNAGERWKDIYDDFVRRKVLRTNGRPFSPARPCNGVANYAVFYRAYNTVESLRLQGIDIRTLPLLPGHAPQDVLTDSAGTVLPEAVAGMEEARKITVGIAPSLKELSRPPRIPKKPLPPTTLLERIAAAVRAKDAEG